MSLAPLYTPVFTHMLHRGNTTQQNGKAGGGQQPGGPDEAAVGGAAIAAGAMGSSLLLATEHLVVGVGGREDCMQQGGGMRRQGWRCRWATVDWCCYRFSCWVRRELELELCCLMTLGAAAGAGLQLRPAPGKGRRRAKLATGCRRAIGPPCARRTGSDWRCLCLACMAFVTPDMPSHATHLTLWPGGDVNLARGVRKRFEKREVWQLGSRATCVGRKPADSYRAVPKLPSSANSSNLAFYSLNNAKGWQRILRMLCSGLKSLCTCACILMQLSLHKLLSPI